MTRITYHVPRAWIRWRKNVSIICAYICRFETNISKRIFRIHFRLIYIYIYIWRTTGVLGILSRLARACNRFRHGPPVSGTDKRLRNRVRLRNAHEKNALYRNEIRYPPKTRVSRVRVIRFFAVEISRSKIRRKNGRNPRTRSAVGILSNSKRDRRNARERRLPDAVVVSVVPQFLRPRFLANGRETVTGRKTRRCNGARINDARPTK